MPTCVVCAHVLFDGAGHPEGRCNHWICSECQLDYAGPVFCPCEIDLDDDDDLGRPGAGLVCTSSPQLAVDVVFKSFAEVFVCGSFRSEFKFESHRIFEFHKHELRETRHDNDNDNKYSHLHKNDNDNETQKTKHEF